MLSTGIELFGFGCITYAAYGWNHLVGWLVGGVFLVAIGYVTDDHAATVSFARLIHPFIGRWRAMKVRRQTSKAG